MMEQLSLAVGAELGKGLSEQQLLQECNEAAAGRYSQLASTVATARQRLQGLRRASAEDVAPHLELLGELEAQVDQLEAAVAGMDAASRRLQLQLAALD